MPHLVCERLYVGDIKDGIAALAVCSSTSAFTNVLRPHDASTTPSGAHPSPTTPSASLAELLCCRPAAPLVASKLAGA